MLILPIRSKYAHPVYTLRMPWTRIYVLNCPSLISAAQKQYRDLNFPVIMRKAIGKIAGTSKAVNDLMARDLITDDGFLVGFNKAMHPSVSQGPWLDAINREAVRVFATSLDALNASGPRQVSFFSWIRSEIMLGTTDAVYGPHNPFRDTSVEEAW